MKNRSMVWWFVLACLANTPKVPGQVAELAAPSYGASYSEIKTWFEQRNAVSLLEQRRVDDLRRVVRSRYGQRGLDRLYHNFEGTGAVAPRIPGVAQNVLLTASDNPNLARGARRTQLYANRIHNDGRFQLLSLNEVDTTPLGKTDKDIVYRHTPSGTKGRVEVKDVRPASQRADLPRLKRQIDKMAYSYRNTGQHQALINRQEVIPEIKAYARAKGVQVYENVATGDQSVRKSGTTSIDAVLDDLHRQGIIAGRLTVIRGGAGVGFGVLMAVKSGLDVHREWVILRNPQTVGEGSILRLAQHGSFTMTGVGTAVAGGAQVGTVLVTSERAITILTKVGRVSGGAAVVFFLLAEGFAVTAWSQGELGTDEFLALQATIGGGVGGGIGGAWAGAKIGGAAGACFGPKGVLIGGAIGGMVGGVGGAFGGSYLAGSATDYGLRRYHAFRDAEREREFADFVYAMYGVPR